MTISDKRPGSVITVLSGEDRCGKTTVATNLAAILNDEGARQVCLIDLDVASGDVASSLHLRPQRTLGQLGHRQGILAAAQIKTLLTTYRKDFDCVLAPVEADRNQRLRASVVEDLLTVLPSLYDYVIVDTATPFSTLTLAALDTSHVHLLLTTPDRPAVKKLRRTLDILDLLSYHREFRRIVLNHSDSRIGLSAAQVEKTVKCRIAAYVPSMWDVPISINVGIPLAISQPGHPVSLAIRRFADAYLTEGAASLPHRADHAGHQGRIPH